MFFFVNVHLNIVQVNKYLLSRPYCDCKDVPLFDLLLSDGDAQTEVSRAPFRRLLRTSMRSSHDV